MLVSNMAVVFFKFWPNSIKTRLFWSHIIYVVHKTLYSDIFKCPDFKYDNSFSQFHSNNTQIKKILVSYLIFYSVTWNFSIFNSKILISNMTIVYSSSIQKQHFWSQSQSFFLLHGTLYFHSFEGADFKCDNSFFKFSPKIT